ncbi:hypothetical protein LEP1GSC191_3876 [Leptospira borgpetersenii serovar Mini str. 201000851]|nr:hypothetical protein LEP1GSC191_3876 [Leptospira borgpetersenii serovar Mini str. 201000851]
MFNRIKRYKARFAGAISIFGIAAFSILFYWKSNFGSSIAERPYSVLRAGEYHSKIVLEPEKPDFTNPVQAVGKTELLPEPNSTYNLEITSAAVGNGSGTCHRKKRKPESGKSHELRTGNRFFRFKPRRSSKDQNLKAKPSGQIDSTVYSRSGTLFVS